MSLPPGSPPLTPRPGQVLLLSTPSLALGRHRPWTGLSTAPEGAARAVWITAQDTGLTEQGVSAAGRWCPEPEPDGWGGKAWDPTSMLCLL